MKYFKILIDLKLCGIKSDVHLDERLLLDGVRREQKPGVVARQPAEPALADGRARDATPDLGCYEYDGTVLPASLEWDTREDVIPLTTYSAPQVLWVPGQGPVVAYFNDTTNQLQVAERLDDGSWAVDTIQTAINPVGFGTGPVLRSVSVALNPTTGLPAVAWVQNVSESNIGAAEVVIFSSTTSLTEDALSDRVRSRVPEVR